MHPNGISPIHQTTGLSIHPKNIFLDPFLIFFRTQTHCRRERDAEPLSSASRLQNGSENAVPYPWRCCVAGSTISCWRCKICTIQRCPLVKVLCEEGWVKEAERTSNITYGQPYKFKDKFPPNCDVFKHIGSVALLRFPSATVTGIGCSYRASYKASI